MPNLAGYQGAVYLKTGGAWALVPNIRDVTPDVSATAIDFASRASRTKKYGAGMLEISVAFGMIFDEADSQMIALRTACLAGTTVDMAFLSEIKTSTTSLGVAGTWNIFGFKKAEPLDGGQMVELEAKPAGGTGTTEVASVLGTALT